MPSATTAVSTRARLGAPTLDVRAGSVWLLGALPIGYLGLRGGGYDPLLTVEAGLVVTWIVLLGAAVGLFPARRLGAFAWLGLALLAGFALWTAVSVSWGDNPDGAVTAASRNLLYLAVMVLVIGVVRTRDNPRHLLAGVLTGISFIAAVAVVSRLYPDAFPAASGALSALPADKDRLSFPLNYWNGLGALCAIGLPLALGLARSAKTVMAQRVVAASVPIMVLALYLTESRAGTVAGAVALVAFVALSSDRLALVGTLLVTGTGSLLLIGDARGHGDFLESFSRPQAVAFVLVVLLGTAALQGAVSLMARHAHRPSWLAPAPRAVLGIGGGLVVAAVVGFLLGGGPSLAADRWEEFKTPPGATSAERSDEDLIGRLGSAAGRGRYEMWQESAAMQASSPLTGRGAGSFELWWAENRGDRSAFVRNAHSLYMETFGELGIVGLALLGGLFLAMLVAGLMALARRTREDRPLVAAGIAGLLAFGAAVAVDWQWQIPAIAIAALVTGATLVVRPDRIRAGTTPLGRVAVLAGSIAAIGFLALSLTATATLRDSQHAARDGDLIAAVESARAAAKAQPFAAAPQMQLALILERAGAYDLGAERAAKAIAAEPRNWQPWLVSSRIAAKRGDARKAVADYRRARSLNPRSPVFANATR